MKLIIFAMLFSVSAFSNNEKTEVYQFGKEFYEFKIYKGSAISSHCLKKDAKCDALETIKNPPKVKFNKGDFNGGKNPGAVTCKKFKNTYVVIAKDLDGNQQSFCVFKDQSMVSTGILGSLY